MIFDNCEDIKKPNSELSEVYAHMIYFFELSFVVPAL